MAKKPEPAKAVTWGVYCAAHKPKIVGSVQAYYLRRVDGDYVVFYFAEPEDADAFCERFGGERLSVVRR